MSILSVMLIVILAFVSGALAMTIAIDLIEDATWGDVWGRTGIVLATFIIAVAIGVTS